MELGILVTALLEFVFPNNRNWGVERKERPNRWWAKSATPVPRHVVAHGGREAAIVVSVVSNSVGRSRDVL